MPVDYLELTGKTIVVFGVANRKSVAWHIGQVLAEAEARVVYVVRTEARREALAGWLPEAEIHVCDVEHDEQIEAVAGAIRAKHPAIHGLVHSIAFADYEGGEKPFHETTKEEFLRAVDVSCFSLVKICEAMKDLFDADASVVTISISTTRMASESYGYMAPIKAALDSSLAFLAKSFSRFSRVRFNAVGPGLLKTSASAGTPRLAASYLFAPRATLRRAAVRTEEAANVAAFLLSPRSSGTNTEKIVVDAGMSVNYFDNDFVRQK